jgi:HEAT repeat protein
LATSDVRGDTSIAGKDHYVKIQRSLGVLLAIVVAIGILSLGKKSDAQEKEPVHDGKTVSQWIELLKSRDSYQRRQAADALLALGPQAKAAVPALALALKDADRTVRELAALALRRLGPHAKGVVPALVEVLRQDKDEFVRWKAAFALRHVGLEAKIVPDLLEACKDVLGNVRWEAQGALRQIGPGPEGKAAVPALIKALEDEKWPVRAMAAECLGRVGPEAGAAVPALLKLLKDDKSQVRGDAAEAVGRIGGGAKPEAAIAALSDLLLKEDRFTGNHSAWALTELGEPGIAALVQALESAKPGARRYAVIALQEVGLGAKAAVPALIKALEHEDARLHSPAAYSLGRMGPAAKAALPALTKALRDSDPHVRINAADALRRIDDSSAGAPALIEVCKDASPSNRCTAAMVLADFGPAAKDAVPALLELLKDSDPYIPSYAAFALWKVAQHERAIPALIEHGPASEFLGQIGPDAKAAAPALTKAALDKDPFRAAQAIEALGKIGAEAKSALPVIRPFLKTDDVRKVAAALALWRLERSPEAVGVLMQALHFQTHLGDETRGDLVRWRAADALRDIGSEAKAAVPALRAALYDEDWTVRRAASAALTRIDPQATIGAR